MRTKAKFIEIKKNLFFSLKQVKLCHTRNIYGIKKQEDALRKKHNNNKNQFKVKRSLKYS